MAKVKLARDLDQQVARMIAPHVRDVAQGTSLVAKRLAPPTKFWITLENGKVCRHCRPLHNVELPENLRFAATSYDWDRQHRGVGPKTYLLEPRDRSSLAEVMVTHCKCLTRRDPNGIAKLISVTPTVVNGTKVTATVVCEGRLVKQAEWGDVYDGGRFVAPGTRFMGRAAALSAQLTRARQ